MFKTVALMTLFQIDFTAQQSFQIGSEKIVDKFRFSDAIKGFKKFGMIDSIQNGGKLFVKVLRIHDDSRKVQEGVWNII
jgi:hypothetical protein